MKIFEILGREKAIDAGVEAEAEEIEQEEEQEQEQDEPKVHNLKVESSWIAGLTYDEETQIATMVLNTGQSYEMDEPMSKQTFSAWYNADSKGKHFHREIRNVYIY